MSPRPPRALRLPLETGRLRVRELTDTDEADYVALYGDERITRHLLYGPADADGARQQLARALRRQRAPRRDSWELGVELAGTSGLIGACDLTLHSKDEAEIGYLLAHGRWGRGYGTEIAVALAQAAFGQLGVARVLSTVEIHNDRSLRVLDKAGLRWEGTLRRYARARRRWWDVHLYTVSREEWLTART
jgi:ribosomal-protein-alanine N-acetyltransferase